MNNNEKKACHGIIHTASTLASGIGTGLAQIPMSDNLVITPIQLTMIISLGKVFGVSLSESSARAALSSAAAATVGRTISQVAIGWIPVLGNIINAVTAATITETIGWILANEFAKEAQCAA